jgi:hypothetical protein
MNMKASTCLIPLLWMHLSCMDSGHPNEPVSMALPGTTWQLERIDTIGGNLGPLLPADTIMLTFDDDRHFSGVSHGLCGNTYFGVYTLPGGDSLSMDHVSTTKAGCRTGSLYWEYWQLLWKAEHYQRWEGQLIVSCDQKSRRLVFRLLKQGRRTAANRRAPGARSL